MDPEEAAALNQNLFDRLSGKDKYVKTPEDEFIETAYLEPFYADKDGKDGLDSIFVMADWLEEHGYAADKVEKLREVLSQKQLRENFVEAQRCRAETAARRRVTRDGLPSCLDLARQEQRRQVLRVFPWFLEARCRDSINDFIRQKLREEGYARRIMPPQPIEDADLGADVIIGTPITVMDFS